MDGTENSLKNMGRCIQMSFSDDDILNDMSGKNLKETTRGIVAMLDRYFKNVICGEWHNITDDMLLQIKSRIEKGTRLLNQKKIPDDVHEKMEWMYNIMRFKRMSKDNYRLIKLIPQFDDYIKLIDTYIEATGTLYNKLAERCKHYYRGTTTDESESLLVSRQRWANYYDEEGYCCLSSVPAAALDYALKRRKQGKESLIIRYSKELASGHIKKPGYVLSSTPQNNIYKPTELYRVYEMEIRLDNDADPKTLEMVIMSFMTDPQKQNELRNRYSNLGTIVFVPPNIDAEGILQIWTR